MRSMSSFLKYRKSVTIRQRFSLFLLLLAIDQSTNSFVLFLFFAVFFFSFFSQLRQGAVCSIIIYLIYFLRQIFGGSPEWSILLSMGIYYSLIFTILLLALTPSFLWSIGKTLDESFLWTGRRYIQKTYPKSDLFKLTLVIVEIVLALLFLFRLGIDIYKSFLWRTLIWSIFLDVGLLMSMSKFLSVHPLVCHVVRRSKLG
jgi:hypothetical protein